MIGLKAKAVVVALMVAVSLAAPVAPALAATDVFTNCATTSNGTKVCGPCADKATSSSPLCQQASQQNKDPSKNPVVNALRVVANGFALAGGVAAVIMIIISGLRFVMAGGVGFKNAQGAPTAAARARATLLYSVVGLIVISLAWAIVRLVTDRLLQ